MLILALFACSATRQQNHGKQGIFGRVSWVEGNLMPAPGDTTYLARSRGKAVVRDIYIYPAITVDKLSGRGPLFEQVPARLVKKVRSKADGSYFVSLPPGKYSLLVMEKEGFFANVFDHDGYVNAVTVVPGVVSECDIIINYRAKY